MDEDKYVSLFPLAPGKRLQRVLNNPADLLGYFVDSSFK